MPNRNYRRGSAKEHRVVVKLKLEGWDIAQRSAGSHSPVDIFAIDHKGKKIKFIQCKPKKFSIKQKLKLEKEYKWMNATFDCKFEVI